MDLNLAYSNHKVDDRVTIYTDADFGGDAMDKKSTSGVMAFLYGNIVDWCVRKQTIVSMSSAESEYIALATAGKLTVAWKNFLETFGESINPVPIFSDSNAAIAIASTYETKRTKHIDLNYHFI